MKRCIPLLALWCGHSLAAERKPLQIDILAGQSNRQGHADITTGDAKQGDALAGFAWFQGGNDIVDSGTYPKRDQPDGCDAYSAIRQKANKLTSEGKMDSAEEKATLAKMRMNALTDRERLILEKGISNLEFHSLGSAKILGGIGRALAEAMADLKQFKN